MRKLQPEALRRLNKLQFERFCQRLLEVEYEARFEPGAVDIEGAAEEDVGDGGRDLRALVRREPSSRSHWDLLPNRPCDTWYSCKSHRDDGRERDPGGWRTQVRGDLDPTPRLVDGNTGELVTNAAELAEQKKRRPPRDLLRALAGGGCYVVLVNVRAERQVELERELRTLFEFWIRKLVDPEARLADDAVRVRDASHLVNLFNTRPFALAEDLEQQLALAEPPFLADWQRWTQRYTRERRRMQWQPDARRRILDAQLRAFLTGEEGAPVFRLWGPPGVGKTRLVHHVLGDAGVSERVRACEEVGKVRAWLTDPGNALAGDLILVVDEVAPADAAGLARDFRAHAPATARLVMIGPQELGHQGQPESELLDRLDDAQTRAILIDEMRSTDARIELALGLCRGYPLFAYWLGHALANDPGLLAEPGAALSGDDDPWDATCAVLVGPRGGDEQAWRDLATRRAKAILLASLTSEHPWSRLEDDARRGFAEALGLSWAELEAAATHCINRSLLRVHGERRYVSPANLERLVLNHFFSDKGPGGPPLDPKRLARTLPPFFANLSTRAGAVHASDSCKRNLAHGALSAIESAARSRDLARLSELAPLLRAASFALPGDAVTTIAAVVEALGAEAVVEASLSDLLSASLKHISHRRISAASFKRVESLLFELARHESYEPQLREALSLWAWKRLFRAWHHLTRQPFELRFELLTRRLRSENPKERELAVDALGFAMSPEGEGWEFGWDDVDGPWEHKRHPRPDHSPRLERMWSALLHASEDPSGRVRAQAREHIAYNLPVGLAQGLQPADLDQLTQRVPSWNTRERERLAERTDSASRHDYDSLTRSNSLASAFARLREAVAPASLEEQVIAQVGRWHPGPLPLTAENRAQVEHTRDRELARALTAKPDLLAPLLPYLSSPAAVRASAFARALGQEDRSQELLATLRDHTRDLAGHRFTAAYLVGWLETVGDATFDAWLAKARAHESPLLLARVLTMAPANDPRAQLLLELLHDHELPGSALAGFGFFAPWPGRVSTELLDRLLLELSRRDDGSLRGESLGLLEARLRRATDELSPEVRAAAHELLASQSDAPSAIVARAWAQSVVALAAHGDLRPLRDALERACSSSSYPHHIVEALEAMAEAGLSERVGPVSSELLATRDEAEREWLARILADASPELRRWADARVGRQDTQKASGG